MNKMKRIDRTAALAWPFGYLHITRNVNEWEHIDCEFHMKQGVDESTFAFQVMNVNFNEPKGGSYVLSVFEDRTFQVHLQLTKVKEYLNASNQGVYSHTTITDKRVTRLQPDIVKMLHPIIYFTILLDRHPGSPREGATSRDWWYEIRKSDLDLIEAQIRQPLYELLRLTAYCLQQ